jgi:hypothetical protein
VASSSQPSQDCSVGSIPRASRTALEPSFPTSFFLPRSPAGQARKTLQCPLKKTLTVAPDPIVPGLCAPFRCLIEITSRQQQTQRTLLDWLRVEYAIEKPSNKLLAVTDLDSDTWARSKKLKR